MTLWKTLPLFLVLSFALPATTVAQSPSLAGQWRTPYRWVIVVEQDGTKVTGSWKESYRDKAVSCSGIFFDGVISGDKVSGTRHPCGARTQPLDIKIVNQDTLEMSVFAPGGTATTTRLSRIKK